MRQKENAPTAQGNESAPNNRAHYARLSPREARALTALVHAHDWISPGQPTPSQGHFSFGGTAMKHFFESYVLPTLTGAAIGGILFAVLEVLP